MHGRESENILKTYDNNNSIKLYFLSILIIFSINFKLIEKMENMFNLIKFNINFSQNFNIYYLVYLKNCLYYIIIFYFFFYTEDDSILNIFILNAQPFLVAHRILILSST